MIRVLVADDHAVVRQGLRYMLERQPDMAVAGEAPDGEAAVRLAVALRPDVVLLDLVMPVRGGVEVVREIARRCPATAVVVLSSFHEDEQVAGAVQAGALGYVLKDAEPEALLEAVRAAARGESVLRPPIAGQLIGLLRGTRPHAEPLTPRELEVLAGIACGQTNREIAGALHLGEETVKTHVSRLLAKLGVADRTGAAVYAVRHGLLAPDAGPRSER
jgi:two-component system, NarL family, response regulator LiaR